MEFPQRIAPQLFGSLDYDGWVDTIAVNAFRPMRVAETFFKNVMASKSLGDNQPIELRNVDLSASRSSQGG